MGKAMLDLGQTRQGQVTLSISTVAHERVARAAPIPHRGADMRPLRG